MPKKDDLNRFLNEILNSYSQIFFSDNKVFAFILILVSFADVYAGLCGFLSVIVTSAIGRIIGFDAKVMSKGIYGYNSLLVGLSLGIYFSPGTVLYVLVILAAILTLFISVSLQGIIGKYGLPFLSMPFVLSAWIMTLGTRNMTFLSISERGIFMMNELYTLGGNTFVQLYDWWNNIGFIRPLKIYFISLGAILFQYNVLSGIIIAAGLLYYSRISFSLSLIGFFAAYLFYDFVGADITENNYSYIGFNYILTSIALGGFFIIPSIRSYLWSILLIPVVAIISISLYTFFVSALLPIYALPFNLVTLLFIYTLKFRLKPSRKLTEVVVQQNSPEKNLYSFENYSERFRYDLMPMRLPFYGTWTVKQGYDGPLTHKGPWKHAIDFVIETQEGKQYKDKGDRPEDYFCYNKPVLSPADGFIESVIDDIEDNIIGKPNIRDNWGNTVIIRHNPGLYSSLSHLRKGSVAVKPGERIKQGSIIGKCGNSGRSPYPHLHFQIQSLPYIGSHTIDYPLSYYIEHGNSRVDMKNFSVPASDQKVSNIQTNELLVRAFDLIPGKTFCFESLQNREKTKVRWEVNTTEFNIPFIKCLSTGSVVYFTNDGNLFMCSHYQGKKNTLLYFFFLACFKVPLGFYNNIEVTDRFPLNLILKKHLLFIQDFAAPFIKFLRSEFRLRYVSIDNELMPTRITLKSESINYLAGHESSGYKFNIEIDNTGISIIKISGKDILISASLCQE